MLVVITDPTDDTDTATMTDSDCLGSASPSGDGLIESGCSSSEQIIHCQGHSPRMLDKSTSTVTYSKTNLHKCKYCAIRLTKLRLLDKAKSRQMTDDERNVAASKLKANLSIDRAVQTPSWQFEQATMTPKEIRSMALVMRFRNSSGGKPLKSETFCKCVLQGREKDCRCGEDEKYFDWAWDVNKMSAAVSLQEGGREVIFHKDYSCGTAAIRGQSPMSKDQYFWEIKMTTPVYGTDMMVGVGTEEVNIHGYPNSFCSMLGEDCDSWGVSYDGRVQHGGKKREFCSRFGQGAIIGVHLDMWHGTLAFFKNRHSLGIAFRGLRGRAVYPMACSTAARSGMRVISSRSFPSSLQFLCCRRLRQFVPDHLSVLDSVYMPPGLRAFLANNMTWLLQVPQVPGPAGAPATGATGPPDYICPVCAPLKAVFEACDENDESDEEDVQINRVALNLIDSSDSGSSSSEEHEHPQKQKVFSFDASQSARSTLCRANSGSSNFEQASSSRSSAAADSVISGRDQRHLLESSPSSSASHACTPSQAKKIKLTPKRAPVGGGLQSLSEESTSESEVEDVQNDEQTIASLGKRKRK